MAAFRNPSSNQFASQGGLKREVLKKVQPYKPTFRARAQPYKPTFWSSNAPRNLTFAPSFQALGPHR
jgi:hypothetical protein